MQKKLKTEFTPTLSNYKEAENYAERTIKFTEATSYEGGQNKRARIVQGCICEYVVAEFAKTNGMECQFRTKPDYMSDQYDIYLGKEYGLCDVKSSYIITLAPQVHRKNARINIYIFCHLWNWNKADRKCDFIEIMGWQYAKKVTDGKYFVKKGQEAPWLGRIQQFGNGSYFYTDELIIPESLVTGIVEPIYPDGHGYYDNKRR